MNPNILETLFNNFDPFPIVKWILIAILLIYVGFATMVIRQIQLMTKTLKSEANKYIFFLGYTHLIVALIVLLGSIIFL